MNTFTQINAEMASKMSDIRYYDVKTVDDIICAIFLKICHTIILGNKSCEYTHHENIPDEVIEHFRYLGYDIWYDDLYDDPNMCKSAIIIDWTNT